jgi:hypothetical protein
VSSPQKAKLLLQNRGFIGHQGSFYLQIVMSLIIIGTNVAYFLEYQKILEESEIVVLNLMWVLRSAIVAAKYAVSTLSVISTLRLLTQRPH